MLGLLLNTKGYYIGLIYVSAALMFFLLRTLKLRIEPEVSIISSFTVAAPLIAALDYWPLLNRGRKNEGLNNIF